ncbi:hypothetical protein NQ315_009743 [Exocentrus adspersus]|uniref:Shavenoid isoform B-like N-terminal domain-containing protein n=1 Tax=Exocentrus adspersus TaxID=1586481 RepID=A0AAV8WHH4_9CUCU|nr:hypothetical protein NQ315_009743 [Exocentrus adspersus]
METERYALKASWLLVTLLLGVVPTTATPSTEAGMGSNLHITRHNSGDIFSQLTRSSPVCTEDTCVGLSSGTATALSETDLCTCRCHPHLPAFREDLRICVDDIHECVLAPFVGGATSQQIPFVFLPLKGQIIHPSKEISFEGIQTPVCAVSGAKFMTESGWMELRNPVDADVPFRLFRDEGRTFLQWIGEPDLRNKMSGRLVLVYLVCRDLGVEQPVEQSSVQMFSPCVAFRVVGTPTKYLSNVTEVAFIPDAHSSDINSEGDHLSFSEYIAIGVCSVLLGLIYVASVFLYIHLKKRNSSESSDKNGLDNQSLGAVEEGIVKNNPLLAISSHFPNAEAAYSDSNSSDTEATPDIIQHHDDRRRHMQITSAMIHPPRQLYSYSSRSSPFSSLEHLPQDSTTNERLPEENVSIVETLEGREDRPDNVRALTGTTRKKLYFNPAYFEPELMMAPPPAALEFLSKIREVIAIAKQKMESKKFAPSLLNIPEEENPHRETLYEYEISKSVSRRSSAISLKRENSRRKTCTGCPGCEPQDFKSLNGKLPEFPTLPACQNCTVTANDSKQRSIRKWLEDVPIIRTGNESSFHQDVVLMNSVRRLRSPTRSLPPDNIDTDELDRALSPRPASERGVNRDLYNYKVLHSRPTRSKPRHKQSYYETVPLEKEEVAINLPPPDMIHEAMAVDKSEEKVTTLTKQQMNAVINELTVHRDLLKHQVQSPVPDKKNLVPDYETDSLERSGNKGFSTPTEYADASSSQPSPNLSTALPDHEEMTMRNAIFNTKTGNMTISKINMDMLQEDEHDYELIVLKKGTIIDGNLYKLPELLQRNNGYSLVSEVYVNNGYNYSSNPSTPSGSSCSSLEKKSLKVRYEEGFDKPGRLLIEVEDCPDNYIPVNDSDNFEPDTLDRKPSKKESKSKSREDVEFVDSLERPHQILLRTTGSFKSDSVQTEVGNVEPSNFNRMFGSLREIYEAKTKGLFMKDVEEAELSSVLSSSDGEGRLLTLEERHSKRQRAKGIVQPDVIPPPPHDGTALYEHPKPPRKIIAAEGVTRNGAVLPKNSLGRSVSRNQNHDSCAAPDTPEDYKLCLVQKSRKDGNITKMIQTEDVVVKKGNNDIHHTHLAALGARA